MDDCCGQKAEEIKSLRGKHKNVLIIVLVINAVLFVVEAAAGFIAQSTALLADSLDMLGDSLVYGFSLYVLWRSAEWKAKAAVLKGTIMAVFGVGVLLEAVYKLSAGVVPVAETMGVIGLLVLIGNGFCFLLPRSVSDFLIQPGPDVLVGAAIAGLFLRSAVTVLRESFGELRIVKSTTAS